jgi:hypothetical protein
VRPHGYVSVVCGRCRACQALSHTGQAIEVSYVSQAGQAKVQNPYWLSSARLQHDRYYNSSGETGASASDADGLFQLNAWVLVLSEINRKFIARPDCHFPVIFTAGTYVGAYSVEWLAKKCLQHHLAIHKSTEALDSILRCWYDLMTERQCETDVYRRILCIFANQ